MNQEPEQMNIVIVGHVDHGKSTVIGRLLADTGSLPEGRLEQVRLNCERNAKPFEYAFLLDALKDEQAQGITIDSARCFFRTAKRRYIIIDAPGHIEFLKNMISGAARAEAALLVIDAKEGIRENSRRHGFMLSLLGINQVVVLVNKMDLVGYRQEVYQQIQSEFTAFLKQVRVEPEAFVPISAREGDNLVSRSERIPWYQGPSVLELIDGFEKERDKEFQPFRFPVQDIYKFTECKDDRRIFAGTVATGKIKIGDEVIFLPSRKKSRIQSIEGFHQPVRHEVGAGYATGFTLTTQIYVKPGELMCRCDEPLPFEGKTFRANIFWMGKQPMVPEKKYKLKLATSRSTAYLQKIITVLNSADLTAQSDRQIERHEVAECVLQTIKPIAFDLSRNIEETGRFVIIDNYEIVGGGIIQEALPGMDSLAVEQAARREYRWERGRITPEARRTRYRQNPKFVVLTGGAGEPLKELAVALEQDLFESGYLVYYLGIFNLLSGPGSNVKNDQADREEQIRRLGELAHFFSDAGQIFITGIPDLDPNEAEILKTLNHPHEILIIDWGTDPMPDYPVALYLEQGMDIGAALAKIKELLFRKEVLFEYYPLKKETKGMND